MTTGTAELQVILQLSVQVPGEHQVRLTRKALSGMEAYQRLWQGPVRMMAPEGHGPTQNLDEEVFDTRQLPFAIEVLDPKSPKLRERVRSAAVVVTGPDLSGDSLARYCKQLGVPCVLNTEYSLRTRWQIARADLPLGPRLVRRLIWEGEQELRTLRQVASATAVQCNGTPTYRAYRPINRNALLYFDTRTTESMLATAEHMRARAARRARGEPLRLAFSGRLNAMKGADDLPKVAKALRARGVPFHFDICGGGPVEADMRREVARERLESCVTFRGVLDFEKELTPLMREEIDLFVCCHRQGDPSCTYLETFACGVPIVGYANEAFSGLLGHVSAGESVAIGDVQGLADAIGRLARPEAGSRLESMGQAALEFARRHTFEATFERRIEHFRSVARQRS
jgi:colanic acid/amylovoran biosynthesis glycosyltransferase